MNTQAPTKSLEFECRECSSVYFSVLDNQNLSKTIQCECEKYALGEQILTHLRQFKTLQTNSRIKSIFGQAAIAIDVGPHQVKIPSNYYLLA